jgi:hypothetical protein
MSGTSARWGYVVIAALIGGAIALFAFAVSSADATDNRDPVVATKGDCDKIEMGGTFYAFSVQHMRCRTAKHYAKHLRRDPNWEPRRFDCSSGSNFQDGGSCQHVRRENRGFAWHPFD